MKGPQSVHQVVRKYFQMFIHWFTMLEMHRHVSRGAVNAGANEPAQRLETNPGASGCWGGGYTHHVR